MDACFGAYTCFQMFNSMLIFWDIQHVGFLEKSRAFFGGDYFGIKYISKSLLYVMNPMVVHDWLVY